MLFTTSQYNGYWLDHLLYHFMLLFVFKISENVKLLDNFCLFFSHNLRARTMCGDLSPQFNGIMSIGTTLIAHEIGSVTFALQKILPVGYISDPILLFFSTAALVL